MLFLFQGCLGLSFKNDRAYLGVNNGQDLQDGRIYRIDCFGVAVG
jgi:hypothetical protein